MKLILILLLISNIFIGLSKGYGESDSNGNPNFLERESHNLLNVVRMFPNQYKYDFMKGYSGLNGILTSKFPSVPPLYYYNPLNRLAKAHSYDMVVNNCFEHNDCNGTNIWTRFANFIPCSTNGYSGENIAYGTLLTGVNVNNMLICEGLSKSCPGDDQTSQIGHRSNIMSSHLDMVGVGNYLGDSNSQYYTQDFLSGQCSSPPSNPIYSGYHTLESSDKIKFLSIFYNNNNESVQIEKMQIVFQNERYKMNRKYGNSGFGVYEFIGNFTECQQYFFVSILENGEIFRYPDNGYLQTVTISTMYSCNDGWSLNGFTYNPNDYSDQSLNLSNQSINVNFLFILIFSIISILV